MTKFENLAGNVNIDLIDQKIILIHL